jgi:2-polyprenyl-6-methoxyphenol hydroxylase-like FAD-dependent oxidoreductase
MTDITNPWAIVVGAGPSGLLLGLLLAKHGIRVQLLEMSSELDNKPRATHYGPPAIYELRRAGVAAEMRAEGFTPRTICWRKLDGTFLAGLDGSVLDDDPDRMVCLPLNQLGKILHRRLSEEPLATISWNHKVTAIGQDADKAWVDVETPEGSRRLEAAYIIGCDGANSQIRRCMFGERGFPGKTWEEQIVATNVCIISAQRFHTSILIFSNRPTTISTSSAMRTPIS